MPIAPVIRTITSGQAGRADSKKRKASDEHERAVDLDSKRAELEVKTLVATSFKNTLCQRRGINTTNWQTNVLLQVCRPRKDTRDREEGILQ